MSLIINISMFMQYFHYLLTERKFTTAINFLQHEAV